MKLGGRVIKIPDLTNNNIEQMFRLMQTHYDNVSREVFLGDLSEKDWAILLEDTDGIKGFSTQMQFEHSFGGKTITIVFSGDTIIDKSCWGTTVLPVTFGQMMLDIQEQEKGKDLYWFLISKGYRTYRFLPIFFKTYCPSVNGLETEFEMQLLKEIAKAKFGSSFDAETSIIHSHSDSQRVKSGICDISNQRRKDKHIAFFEKLNPGYANGDELACIARFDRNNLMPFILKRITGKSTIGASK